MKRPRSVPQGASLAMNDGDDMSSFSSASTYCSPRRRRKQQRTMEDAFRLFTIGNEKVLNERATTSSNCGEAMKDIVDEEDNESSCSSLEDELLLTDQERAERKVMFELVFGKSHEDVVEAKLQEWIQNSAREATTSPRMTNRQPGVCQDDIHLPSATARDRYKANVDNDQLGNNSSTRVRQRSNSLPTDIDTSLAWSEGAIDEVSMEENDGMELSL